VPPGSRAGTRTRVALRQLGIRNATDLLKAFPPDQIDPREGGPASDAAAMRKFDRLNAAGMDVDQIRILVRVLDEDTGLAPVWNWQTRGAQARSALRLPRTLRPIDLREPESLVVGQTRRPPEYEGADPPDAKV
jgi:hypothetical protein